MRLSRSNVAQASLLRELAGLRTGLTEEQHETFGPGDDLVLFPAPQARKKSGARPHAIQWVQDSKRDLHGPAASRRTDGTCISEDRFGR